MGSVYANGKRWFLSVKDANGEWTAKSSGIAIGDTPDERTASRRRAKKMLEKVETALAAQRDIGGPGMVGPVTVKQYADRWSKEREALGLATWKDQQSMLRMYILPTLGPVELAKVRPRDLATLFQALRLKGEPSPKRIINIYSATRAMFRDAQIADLVETSPCILTKHQLGSPVDKDPDWRRDAVFSRAELVTLLTDARLLEVQRIVHALAGLAGLRHGELAGLQWRRYDATRKPLGSLSIATSYDKGRTKTGEGRLVPVHPVLATILDEWKRTGWVQMIGREPKPDDVVVPVEFDEPKKQARRNPRGGQMRNKSDTYKRWVTDLKKLDLRHRRFHDLRATFITLALDDGAEPHVLERVTHNPKRTGTAFNDYSRPFWETLCREVAKLSIDLAPPMAPTGKPGDEGGAGGSNGEGEPEANRGDSDQLSTGFLHARTKSKRNNAVKGGGAGSRKRPTRRERAPPCANPRR